MRLLTLNIRHGGGTRIPAVVDYLAASDADMLVLTEYRAGAPGERLEAALGNLGYRFRWRSVTEPRTNGVLLASRLEAEPLDLGADAENARRILGCRVGGLSLYGVYFALGQAKRGLFELIAERSAAWVRSPAILIGDFNTGRPRIDEAGATFHLAGQFEALENRHGWTDAWRHLHGPDARAYSWYSTRGNGFRIDHAFASRAALERIRGTAYDHGTRPSITDHSALLVELD